jgi:hypothetical protein
MTIFVRTAGAAVFLAIPLTIPAVPALAQAQGTAEERSACMSDAFRFCRANIPNVAAIEACLKQNVSSLSPACQAEFAPAGSTKLQSTHFR